MFVSLLWTTRLLLLNVTLVFAPKKNIDHFLIRQLVVHFYVLTCVFVDLKFKKDLKGVHLEEKLCHSILKEGENSVLMLVKVSKSLLGWGDWHQSFRFQINCVRKYSFLRLGSMNYQFNSLNFESLQTTLWNTLIQKTWRHGEKYFGCRNHFFYLFLLVGSFKSVLKNRQGLTDEIICLISRAECFPLKYLLSDTLINFTFSYTMVF